MSIPIPNKKIENFDESILFILDLIHPNRQAKGVEYRISKINEFIVNFIQDHAETVRLVASDGSIQEIRVFKGKLFRCKSGSTVFDTGRKKLRKNNQRLTSTYRSHASPSMI